MLEENKQIGENGAPVEKKDSVDVSASEENNSNAGSNDKKPFAKGFKLEKGTTAYEIFDWIRTICIGVLAGIFIVVFLVQRDDVYGDSMVPTLSSGDIIYAQKISTYFHSYKRGDILILDGHDMEGYNHTEYLVKRVVGLPGETIRIADGNVYIKAADSSEFYLLQENYLPGGLQTTMREEGLRKGYDEITLAENEYYCLGDNRPVSNDSRSLGPFTADRIKGVAVIRVFPFNEIKTL
ncbi:MAG: signal peptidase I [Saccharofermentans sp.]|nr:signal peptidase I [Saccharofermentans sp.]